ncbi:APC family permease [Amnibacterium kyonggiense]|uniref:Amino acid transporter n=1 Tax=Amnibacterium kyonggiense TaxID=595671 RepID=A0A4R7FKE2_9MICO|nr:APC family permease [Amnibacterium kyonggiense]TDS76815.1 amino acid transporter [Amnibacterium kyonggiense]
MTHGARPDHGLSTGTIGLTQGVFQALTHMGPAAGVASSLLVAVSFAGAATPLAVILTLVVVLLIGIAVGSLARVFSSAGGLAAYVEQVLGRRAGIFVSWLYAPLELLIAPIVFIFFGQFLSGALQSSLGIAVPWWVFAVLAAVFVCVVNVRGVKQSTTAGVVLGLAEVVIFVALAVWIIVAQWNDNTLAVLDPSRALDPGWSGIFKAVVFSILAFQGFETAAPLAEETRDPKRVIPRTILYSALACGAFYLICSYAAVLGWGADRMGSFASDASPWIVLAQRFWGPVWLLVLFALINSFLGNANAGTTAASRIVFALGRAGRLPRRFAEVHPVHRTPTFSIYFQTVFGIVLTVVVGLLLGPTAAFSVIGAVITVFAIVIYIVTCAACIRYFTKEPRDRGFNVVLHVIVPAVAIVILLAPLWFQFVPWPDYPGNIGNAVAILLIAVALVSALLTGRRAPAGPSARIGDRDGEPVAKEPA